MSGESETEPDTHILNFKNNASDPSSYVGNYNDEQYLHSTDQKTHYQVAMDIYAFEISETWNFCIDWCFFKRQAFTNKHAVSHSSNSHSSKAGAK